MTLNVQTEPSASSDASGFKECPTHSKRVKVKKRGMRSDTGRHLFLGGSFSRTDDSQMFTWRYCNSHGFVCLWCDDMIDLGFSLHMHYLELD